LEDDDIRRHRENSWAREKAGAGERGENMKTAICEKGEIQRGIAWKRRKKEVLRFKKV